MATNRYRVQAWVDGDTGDALKALSTLGGVSISSFVAQFLEEMVPQIKALTIALETAKRNQVEGFQLMTNILTHTVKEAAEVQDELHARQMAQRRLIRKPGTASKPKTKPKTKSKTAGQRGSSTARRAAVKRRGVAKRA